MSATVADGEEVLPEAAEMQGLVSTMMSGFEKFRKLSKKEPADGRRTSLNSSN